MLCPETRISLSQKNGGIKATTSLVCLEVCWSSALHRPKNPRLLPRLLLRCRARHTWCSVHIVYLITTGSSAVEELYLIHSIATYIGCSFELLPISTELVH